MDVLDEIVDVVASRRYRFESEEQLQAQIADALVASGLMGEREFRLSDRDRVDILVWNGNDTSFCRFAVEVKIDGSTSAVAAQLARYAEHEDVDAIVLVTSKAKHRAVPAELNGKPVRVVQVRRFI